MEGTDVLVHVVMVGVVVEKMCTMFVFQLLVVVLIVIMKLIDCALWLRRFFCGCKYIINHFSFDFFLKNVPKILLTLLETDIFALFILSSIMLFSLLKIILQILKIIFFNYIHYSPSHKIDCYELFRWIDEHNYVNVVNCC